MADVLRGTINILVAKDDGTGNPLYKPIYPKTSIDQIENFTQVLDQHLDTKVNAIPNATDTERGLVIVGPNITNSAGVISITKADIESALGFTPMSQEEMASTALNAQTANTLAEPRTIDGVSFNGSSNIAHFGVCSTAASTSAKSVSCSGFILGPGAVITVTFTTDNTAENPTLNVNNTGPKVIQYRHANISPEVLAANRTYTFVYNGTNYQLVGDVAGEKVVFPVTGVKGEAEANYRHGDINITKANLGLENVNNTADNAKSVASAAVLTNPRNISISGAVTGSATSFNGSADIDIATTAMDVSKANAGILAVARGGTGESSLANVSVGSAARANQLANSRDIIITDGTHEGTATAFNGSANIKIKLPTEITATLHGKADSAAVADSCNGTADTAKKAEQDEDGNSIKNTYAKLNSPTFTGDPKAPTPAATDNDTSIATTAFVHKNVVHYAVCDSDNQAEVKVVNCPNYPFTAGSILTIRFTNGNFYALPKLNVNNTGAKAIKYRGANIKGVQMYAANGIYSFVYDGTDFHFIGDVNEQPITGIRGDSTPANASGTNSEGYYTGKVTLNKADLGLDKVENKDDIERDVRTALRATSDKDGNQIDTTYLKVSAKANTAALADEATKAINDADGNAIKTTYAKLAGPTFTGEPKIQSGSTTSAIATQNYVTTQINSALADVNVEEVRANIATLNAMLEGDGSIAGQINSKQAHSQALDDIVSAAATANRIVYSAANSRYNAAPISTFALSILDDNDAADVRTTIGALGTTEKAASASTADSATSATKDNLDHTIADYYAPISNPIFKDSAQAPTVEDLNDSTKKIATTAFVANKLSAWAQSNMGTVKDLQDFLDSIGGFDNLGTTIQNKFDKGSSVDSIASLTNIPANKMLYTSAKDTWNISDFSSLSRTLVAKNTAAEMLNELSATLASIAGLSVAANQMLYTNDSKKYAMTTISQVGRELLANNTKASMLSYLGAAATDGTVTNATQLENHSASYFMKRAEYGSGPINTSQWQYDEINDNYYADIANSSINAEKMVMIICLPATESIATAAGIKPTNESFSQDSTHSTGYVRIRAEAMPTAAIQIGYYIFETTSSN